MKKFITIIVSLMLVLCCSLTSFADQNQKLVNYGFIDNGIAIDVPIDSNGCPILNSGETEIQSSNGVTVTVTWSLKDIGNDKYEIYFTATCGTGNDTIKALRVDSLVAKNASVLNSNIYYSGSLTKTFNSAYTSQTDLAATFQVTDGSNIVKLESKGVFILTNSNGWISCTDGEGRYYI